MARRFGAQVKAEGVRAGSPCPSAGGSGAKVTPIREAKLTIAKEAVKQVEAESTGKGGRPAKHADKPWEKEGISRQTWYRRRKAPEAP